MAKPGSPSVGRSDRFLLILRPEKISTMAAPLFLNKIFNAGESIGPILAYTMCLLLTIELIYVFVKYVVTSKK